MKTFYLFILTFLFVGVSETWGQRTVAGKTFDGKMVTSKGMIYFNGAGLREKYGFDLYVSALYLKNQTVEGPKVIHRDEAMAISIILVSNKVTRDRFVESVEKGFKKSMNGDVSSLRSKIDDFKAYFSDAFNIDDKIDIIYLPGVGTQVKKNGKIIGTMEGLEFKKALFGIWFGTNPADANLKEAMLGKL
ncbi:MAG: chalcone isomerase family protein [Crocinitomicaceae bacterium]|nr:chalcone isomerase family protein [Crocinitomicaceae bacterium]